MKKLNLGCNDIILKGYINLDINKREGVDVIHDLNKFPYPFKDNSVDEILMNHLLEHLKYPVEVLKECNRILKINGILKIEVPYYKNIGAFVDLTHINFFTEKTFTKLVDFDYIQNYKIIKHKLICKGKFRKLLPFKVLLNNLFFGIYDVLLVELKKK